MLAGCRAGETPWRIHILQPQTLRTMCQSSESLMGMEVIKWKILNYDVGCEVALYVKDRFIDLLKKLPSFKKKDYQLALKEAFIKIDE